MESLKRLFFIILFLLSASTMAAIGSEQVKKTVIKTAYFNQTFGHIHQAASRYSQSLSTVACGHPVKVYKMVDAKGSEQSVFGQGWSLISTGPYEGYLPEAFLANKKPSCFQDKYPKFFESLALELTDMYYWGRLHDHFDRGHSRVNQ